jgi:rSAM/selenodomain-associated transferase 1
VRKGLIVFARDPLPGTVKTRLAATLGDQRAVALYENMLQEVLKATRQLNDIETIVFWSCLEDSLPLLAQRYRCASRRQIQGNLGERMLAAFEEMFANGSDVCCIIGSDAPDLPIAYILEAYRLLEMQHTGAVFGPSRDGGYYLLGLCQVWPKLFANISWSSCAVLEQSLAAALASGLSPALLPEWQDIDTVEDLRDFEERHKGSV